MKTSNVNPKKKKPVLAILGGLVVVGLVAGAVWYWYDGAAAELRVNKLPDNYKVIAAMEADGIPDFDLPRLDGSRFKLSSDQTPVLIVNFWASWCAPCVEEFPSMLKLIEQMPGKVKVLAISTDTEKQDVANFVRAFGLPKPGFEVIWDQDGSIRRLYDVNKIPESFIVAKDRKLLKKVLGIDNWVHPTAIEYFNELAEK